MAMRRDRLTYLPSELLHHIVSYLDATPIALLRLTCRTLFIVLDHQDCDEDHESITHFDSETFRSLWQKDRRRPKDGLSMLPSELLLVILSFVDNTTILLLRQACRRFYHFIPLNNTIITFDFPAYTSAMSRDCLSRLLRKQANGEAPPGKLLCPSCIAFHPTSSFSSSEFSAHPLLRRCIGHERVVRVPDYPDFFFSDLQDIAKKTRTLVWGCKNYHLPMQASVFDIYHQQRRDRWHTYTSPHNMCLRVDPKEKGGVTSVSYRLTLVRTSHPSKPLDLSTDEARQKLLARCNDGDTSTASYICPHMPLNHQRILKPIKRLYWSGEDDRFQAQRRPRSQANNKTEYRYPGGKGIRCPMKACETEVYLRVFGSLAPYIDPRRDSSWRTIALVVNRKIGKLEDANDKVWLAQTEMAREIFGRVGEG